MSFSYLLRKCLLTEPPNSIDFDKLNPKTRRAISALEAIAESDQPTYFMWMKAWPWLETLSRGLMDRPPTTVAGYDMADRFLWIVPGLFLYSISSDHKLERWELLQNVLKTPRVLSLVLELWLFASTTNHKVVQLLCNVLRMFLDFRDTDTSHERLSLPKDCKAVCMNTSRWDVPATCIKEIVRVVCQPDLDCGSLSSILSLLLMVSRDLCIESMPRFIALGVTRWLAIAMSKLASPANYTGSEAPETIFDQAACCVKQIMDFLCLCGLQDSYSLLDALDEGIILSIYKARKLMYTTDGYRGLETNPAPDMVRLLFLLTERLLHRAILVRVVRSIKKADKLGFYEAEESLPTFQKAWIVLKDEALSRHSKVKLTTMPHVCGYEQCANQIRKVYKRCSGCHAEMYCSVDCQKAAWKLNHRNSCRKQREAREAGNCCRLPSMLERAFVHYQVFSDFQAFESRFQELRDQYLKDNPKETGMVIIQLDYSTFPPAMEAMNREQARTKLKWPCGEDRPFPPETMVFGLVPWRQAKAEPLVIYHSTTGSEAILYRIG